MNDNYKPTTDLVETLFATASPNLGLSVPERHEAFRRWLAEHDAELLAPKLSEDLAEPWIDPEPWVTPNLKKNCWDRGKLNNIMLEPCVCCGHSPSAHSARTNYWCSCGCPECLTANQYNPQKL